MAQIIDGRFEIGDVLGQGGMGTVFHGRDLQTGQPVAIKLLRSDVVSGNPGLVARFEREGEALRRLNHPNIVKMLAAVDQDSSHFIVMEYVSSSLQNLLDETASQTAPLPVEQILHIALELADALSRAHHLKIIHRDIKPSNVLVADDGTPRLTDFGIARLDDHTRMTESGLVVGTFAYLSPEACAGFDLDARTDIWSFGVMLYEMLTGTRPFNEDSMAATVTAILNKNPPDVRTLRPDTPPALASLITRMLEKDRDERISSMRQVGAELEAISQGKTTPAPRRFVTPTPTSSALEQEQPATETPRPATSHTRRNIGFALGAVIILLLAGLFIRINSNCCAPPESLTPAPALTADGKYIVLVAAFEAVRTETRDVGRLIADDLKQHLEVDAPYSRLQVIPYTGVIKSDEEAQTAAQATSATVVIWGNYTADTITANVQLGVLTAFKYNPFKRDMLERTANVRVWMTDETKQSLAPNVLAVIGVMFNADGDLYGVSRIWVDLDALKTLTSTDLVGDNTAVQVHRYFTSYIENPDEAVNQLTRAIDADAGNALLYAFRNQAYYRQGILTSNGSGIYPEVAERMNTDAESAQKLGPETWMLAPFLTYRSYEVSLTRPPIEYDQAITARSDDWYLYYLRSTIFSFTNSVENLEKAAQDINRALELDPDVKFPQALAVTIALRRGHLSEAASLTDNILKDIQSDTFLTSRLLMAQWGISNYHPSVIYEPLSKLLLGQNQAALDVISQQLEHRETAFDLTLVGLIHCNLGNLDQAQFAFTRNENPVDNFVANLLEATIYMKQNNRPAALKQLAIVQRSDQGDLLAPFAAAVLNGEFSCKDVFNTAKISQIEAKYGNLKATDLSVTLTAAAPTLTAPATTLSPTAP